MRLRRFTSAHTRNPLIETSTTEPVPDALAFSAWAARRKAAKPASSSPSAARVQRATLPGAAGVPSASVQVRRLAPCAAPSAIQRTGASPPAVARATRSRSATATPFVRRNTVSPAGTSAAAPAAGAGGRRSPNHTSAPAGKTKCDCSVRVGFVTLPDFIVAASSAASSSTSGPRWALATKARR